jgi:hypothetical protein
MNMCNKSEEEPIKGHADIIRPRFNMINRSAVSEAEFKASATPGPTFYPGFSLSST